MRAFVFGLLLIGQYALAQPGGGAADKSEAAASLPDTEFLLSREFDRTAKRIEDLVNWSNQIKRDQNQIQQLLQGQAKDAAADGLRQILDQITNTLKSMNDNRYWSTNPQEIGTKFNRDVRLLEQSADRIGFSRDPTSLRQLRSYISRRISDAKDTGLLDVYLAIDRIVQSQQQDSLPSPLRELLNSLSNRDLEDPLLSREGARALSAAQIAAVRAKISQMLQTLDKAPRSLSQDNTNSLRQAVDGEINKALQTWETERATNQKRLETIAKKIEEVKKKGASTFDSTNYMMLLLAFSFGITVILRSARNDLPIITDQTLVEYGGMSFLILAVIILASGDKINANTVGPLLGTIAGYIFGKSVALQAGRRNRGQESDEGKPQEEKKQQHEQTKADERQNQEPTQADAGESRPKSS